MKNALFTLSFLLTCAAVYGQIEIRPMIGTNFTEVSKTPDGSSTQAKLGWQIGGHVLVGNKFHLYPGIYYYQTNVELTNLGEQNDLDSDQRIGGVKIPILAGYRFVDPESDPFLNVRLFAGPSLAFVTESNYSNSLVEDNIDWNSSSWAGMVGLGLDVSIFFLDVSYEFGLSDVHGTKEGAQSFEDVRNNSFIINAGVRLKLAT